MAQVITPEAHATAGTPEESPFLYGIAAEFDDAHAVVDAATQAHQAGYRHMDAYTPFPIEGLSDALGHRDHWIPYIMLAGGVSGCILGFGFLTWCQVFAYPFNSGGHPLFGWPSYIPITFECTVLLSALSGVFGMFMLNGLPQPYHPIFDAPEFIRASADRFFLCIEADDERFDRDRTRDFMEGLHGVVNVTEVPLRK